MLKSMQNLDQITQDAVAAFAATDDPDTLEQIKAPHLGRAATITELPGGMQWRLHEERKATGALINRAKEAIEAALNCALRGNPPPGARSPAAGYRSTSPCPDAAKCAADCTR